jgi:hypothetical protein
MQYIDPDQRWPNLRDGLHEMVSLTEINGPLLHKADALARDPPHSFAATIGFEERLPTR